MKKQRTTGRQTTDQKRVARVMEFLSLGCIDYLGARTLLRHDLPLQGAILASTAVEKYFKAFAALRGNVLRGHLSKKHMNLVKNFAPDLFEKLSREFLEMLSHCYQLRYTDGLAADFNLTIFSRECLAELDHTIFHCEFQLNLRRGNQQVRTSYKAALEKKDPVLLEDNYVLLKLAKSSFLSQPDIGYSILNRPTEGILEAVFKVFESPSDGHFTRQGIRRVPESEIARMLKEEELDKPASKA